MRSGKPRNYLCIPGTTSWTNAIRVAIGSLHTEERDVRRAWELVRTEAARLES